MTHSPDRSETAGRSRHRAWRLSSLAVLLTLTMGSGAQTSPGPHAAPSPSVAVQDSGAVAAPAPVLAPPDANPLPADFDIARFEAMARQLVADQRIPGLAMAIVHNGRVLSVHGYGVTDVKAAEPVDAHTVFRLASLSKAFAATTAGMLVNDGSLRWDNPVTRYVPGFRLNNAAATSQVTVADLVSHRVGLVHNTYDHDLEAYVDYRTLTQKLANAPLQCQPGTCYGYQNIAFSLIGDVVFAATGDFYAQQVQRRILKPLGMNDASLGLEGLEGSARWARPHVRGRGGWVPVKPKSTYYQVLPAAGVNASASDMAQWLIAHTGHRPDVLPAPLLATLHSPLVDTPTETRGSPWRRARVQQAGYALGWRVYDYMGHTLVFHGGAVQGYRGVVAMLPDKDLGIALMWNGESSLPSGMVPTIMDRALGIDSQRWLDVDFDEPTLFADSAPATTRPGSTATPAGSSATKATAAPR